MSDYSYSSTDYVGSSRLEGTSKIVTTNKKNNADLDFSDFLKLMIAQLKNQDFMDPVDDSQYMTQMTQFASMQAMNELADYSKTSYAMGLVGKEVTASRYTVSGDLDSTTGTVDKVSLVNNEYVLYIGGKTYSLDQVMQVSNPKGEGVCDVDPSKLSVQYTNVHSRGFDVNWELPTEDKGLYKSLTYQVYYSKDSLKTLDDVKKNGTAFGGKFTNATSDAALKTSITGLESGQTYYVNVVVTDAKGNQAVYKQSVVRTKDS